MSVVHNSSTLKLFSDDNVISQDISHGLEENFLNILEKLSEGELYEFFEIDKCIQWIDENKYQRIALQLPDSYLNYAYFIVKSIEKELKDCKLYVLADTSYRSCCVDDIAAEHAKCDSLIHFGESCLSLASSRMPVLYILGNLPINIELIKEFLSKNEVMEENIVLVYDSSYNKHGEELYNLLKNVFTNKNIFHFPIETNKDRKRVIGRSVPSEFDESLENVLIFFVGSSESPLITLWMMTFVNIVQGIIYDPILNKIEYKNSFAFKLLKKRLFLIEKVRDAESIGLVVGTLGVNGHNEAIQRVRELCKASGKKLYVFSIGKLNEAKLANFSNEIDVFILLSCPFGVLLETRDYYKPLVCLFEAEIGLNRNKKWFAEKGWTSEFLSFINDTINTEICDGDGDDVDVSLVTGQIRKTNLNSYKNEKECQDIQLYSANNVLSNRSWKGLDPNIKDNDDDYTIKEGIKGIGAQYVSEPFNKS
uniref:2-(3-amino-3-carboxypropyl)histidine synthase subunit 2 n=1 Tax=Strongyloides stercoralis TaxID=6248 RepID=A0A0K0E129_STRER